MKSPIKLPTTEQPALSMMAYKAGGYLEKKLTQPSEIRDYLTEWSVIWVNIDGTGSPELIQQVGDIFDLHPLALEDVMHLQERAKVDEYPKHVFIIARMPSDDDHESPTEQVSIFLGKNYVITFQERAGGDCLDPIRTRIRKGLDGLYERDAAYLVYSMMDTIIEAYFPVLEDYGERLETLEDQLALNPTRDLLSQIHTIKRDLLVLRRAVWPMRDVLHMLMHDNQFFDTPEVGFYLRDAYDHVMRVIDLIEVDRELCADLMDFYLSSVGNRTNDVMKILTIISTIFMPLTFVAGVYGMNFNPDASPLNMPELNWYWGYPFAWFVMIALVGGLLYYYRRRGWL